MRAIKVVIEIEDFRADNGSAVPQVIARWVGLQDRYGGTQRLH
jgi:hypothetical protein